jgi:hypothetical protein
LLFLSGVTSGVTDRASVTSRPRHVEVVLIGSGPHGGSAVVVMCDRQVGGHQPLAKLLV